MNTLTLILGKNTASMTFGEKDGERSVYAGAAGPDNKVILGDLNAKKPRTACSTEEGGVSMAMSKKGFVAYWVVSNHANTEIIRVTLDNKARTLELALATSPDAVKVVSTTNLDVFPNPEFKFYNYRSTLTAKPMNAPKRPRGRPRKTADSVSDSETEPKRPRGRPRKVALVEQPLGPVEVPEPAPEADPKAKRTRGRPRKMAVAAEPAADAAPEAKRARGTRKMIVAEAVPAAAEPEPEIAA